MLQIGVQAWQALLGTFLVLSRLDLAVNSLDSAIVAQLTCAHCPLLAELVHDNCNLAAAVISQLVEGNWPVLENLSLRSNKLRAAEMQLKCSNSAEANGRN